MTGFDDRSARHSKNLRYGIKIQTGGGDKCRSILANKNGLGPVGLSIKSQVQLCQCGWHRGACDEVRDFLTNDLTRLKLEPLLPRRIGVEDLACRVASKKDVLRHLKE